MSESVRAKPTHLMNGDVDITLQRAMALHARGLPDQAAALYSEILESHPDHTDALHLYGVAETQRGRPREGLEFIARSLAMNPHQPAAIANQGNAWFALGEFAAALECYDRALSAWPDYGPAMYGRGNAFAALDRPADALVNFERALTLVPQFVEAWIARGGVLRKLGRHAESLAAYDSAIHLAPDRVAAHVGRGGAQLALKNYREAGESLERALALAPHSAEALTERGHLLTELRELDAAIESYDRALAMNPKSAVTWFSRALALSARARFVEAAASCRRVLELDPHHVFAQGACLHAELQVCDWGAYAARAQAIQAAVARGEAADFPFSFLAVCDSPTLQLQCARRFGDLQHAPGPPHVPELKHVPGTSRLLTTRTRPHDRIRVAYVSADFLEHPTSYLAAGLFENHDRQRFDVIGISLRDDDQSPTARRVNAAFDRVISAGSRSDAALAEAIRDLDVDIVVDLMGYTGEHRIGLFAHRPAPIQVNYLGFPGTAGSADRDYLIADEFLIPDVHREAYCEHIVYLPDCFQVNDDRRPEAQTPAREHLGLPVRGFVWCSFHSNYKLNPPLFDVWARLLHAVPHSVLWLLGGNPAVEENLTRETRARGLGVERVVFAKSLPYPEHLARLRLADLCLDTLPFNGGATTSDALWAGVPVVTCAGQSFAARMSGSLLHAIGMPDLITHSLADYERCALELAQAPEELARVRAALARNRDTRPLFDTDRFRRHIEAAYTLMVDRHRNGLAPATMRIPALAT
jgi:predicted O-linked N-acetylglucosamine transferase (SPINDLY family)